MLMTLNIFLKTIKTSLMHILLTFALKKYSRFFLIYVKHMNSLIREFSLCISNIIKTYKIFRVIWRKKSFNIYFGKLSWLFKVLSILKALYMLKILIFFINIKIYLSNWTFWFLFFGLVYQHSLLWCLSWIFVKIKVICNYWILFLNLITSKMSIFN